MRPVHPGEILKEEFLVPLKITANQLAERINVTSARLYEIIAGRRGITANTAIRLSIALGTTVEFWMNLQMAHDIRKQEIELGETISKGVTAGGTAGVPKTAASTKPKVSLFG